VAAALLMVRCAPLGVKLLAPRRVRVGAVRPSRGVGVFVHGVPVSIVNRIRRLCHREKKRKLKRKESKHATLFMLHEEERQGSA